MPDPNAPTVAQQLAPFIGMLRQDISMLLSTAAQAGSNPATLDARTLASLTGRLAIVTVMLESLQ